jgi:hypothetical protein
VNTVKGDLPCVVLNVTKADFQNNAPSIVVEWHQSPPFRGFLAVLLRLADLRKDNLSNVRGIKVVKERDFEGLAYNPGIYFC